jgi:hypothetical protein
MTIALDPNSKGHIESMKQWDPTFPRLLEDLNVELDTLLEEKYDGSLLKLFEKVAIK